MWLGFVHGRFHGRKYSRLYYAFGGSNLSGSPLAVELFVNNLFGSHNFRVRCHGPAPAFDWQVLYKQYAKVVVSQFVHSYWAFAATTVYEKMVQGGQHHYRQLTVRDVHR